MKFFILLAVATVALAGDLSPAPHHLRGHGGSHIGGSHRGGVWGRGRRDVADDFLLVEENQDILANQFAEEIRNRGHSGGNMGAGSWGGNHGGSWGGKRGVRGLDLVDLVAEHDQALEENRLAVDGWSGRGNVGKSGHRWGRDVALPTQGGRALGWGGRTWGIPNQGQRNVWNRRW